MTEPAYLELYRQGGLARRIEAAQALLKNCTVCPRNCGVDRTAGELGDCRTGRWARISSVGPHFGEESPLVGRNGSGTVFYCGCNLNCDFCQNWEISQEPGGLEVQAEQLAGAFLKVQEMGCHNLNVVTPTHVTPQILEALEVAVEEGLRIPIVYNCGGYEAIETLKLLDGIVDIYMPDIKFMTKEPAERFCQAEDYPEVVRAALSEMHRQVGDLQTDENGIATRGLLVRHLVMPEDLASSKEAAEFLAGLSKDTFVNVMAQYRPCHQAGKHKELGRQISPDEHLAAIEAMKEAGLSRLDGVERRRAWVLRWP